MHGSLHKLQQAHARLVVFDVFFPDPDTAEHDAAFAAAMREQGRVILPADLSPEAERYTVVLPCAHPSKC